MRKVFLSLSLILFTSFLYSQLRPAYIELRNHPKDSAAIESVYKYIRTSDVDSLLIANKNVSEKFLKQGIINDYLFLMNQTSANIIAYFRNLEIADSIQRVAMNKAIELGDTLNTEYAVLMKYRGVKNFYAYNDEKSLEFFKRGYVILKEMGIQNDLMTDFKANIGNGYLNTGQHHKALPFMEQAMDESLEYNNALLYMIASQGLGHIAFMADVNLGVELFEQVEKNAVKMEIDTNSKNKFLANICHMLSGYYSNIDKSEKSDEYEQKALHYIQNTKIPDLYLRLNIYNSQIANSIDKKDTAAQIRNIKRLNDALEKYSIKDPNLLMPAFYSIGQSIYSRGMTDSAYYYWDEGLKMADGINSMESMRYYSLISKYVEEGSKKLNLSYKVVNYFFPQITATEKFPEKLNSLNDSAILQKIDNHTFYLNFMPALKTISDNLYSENNADSLKLSIDLLDDISNVILANTNGVVDDKTGNIYSEKFENIISDKIIRMNQLAKMEDDKNINNKIISEIALSQAFYLQKKMAFRERSQSADIDSLWNKYFDLLLAKQQYSSEYQESQITSNPIDENVYQDSATSLGFDLIKLQLLMDKKNMLHTNNLKQINIDKLRSNIPSNKAIINYFVANDSILFTVYVSDDELKVLETHNYTHLKNLLNKVNRNLRTSSDILNEYNQQLTNLLLGDLKKDLLAKDELVIIPHKDLWKIPFEVLSFNGKEMLIQNYAITYHNSLNLWKKSLENTNKSKDYNLMAFAPGFEGELAENSMRSAELDYFSKLYKNSRSDLAGLPYSKMELQKIDSLFSKSKFNSSLYLNKEATEFKFENSISSGDIVHLASHSYVSKQNPFLNGVFFSENTQNKDDAYLFAKEISDINININLLVLSSCNSGSGNIEGSEGVNSLQRYFVLAGVPNVIASLWKVHDKNTMLFMTKFYEYLLNGNSYSKSLQLAKLYFIKNGYSALDWSGFILIGE